MPEESADVLHCHLKDVFAGDTKQTCEVTLELRRGDVMREVELHISSVSVQNPAGERTECRSALFDRSELRQAERERAELQDRLRGAEALEAVGALVSGVAHDLNNVLSGIAGCTTLALRETDAAHPAGDYLRDIQACVSSGMAISEQLLMIARSESVEPSVLELNTVIGEAIPMLRMLAGQGVELSVELQADPSSIRADRGQIEQIIVNLVVNGRDAMPNGGPLRIATRNAFLTESDAPPLPPGPYVVLTVQDRGVGIDGPTSERIFEPFFTTKTREEGTGLGLFTVHSVAVRNGGRVTVESLPEHGSTFEVFLPCASAEQASPKQSKGGR
jgi:signal transduction histidine kinase